MSEIRVSERLLLAKSRIPEIVNFGSALPPKPDIQRVINDLGNLVSALPRWSQLIDATLYLKQQDGVFRYGSKVSSRI